MLFGRMFHILGAAGLQQKKARSPQLRLLLGMNHGDLFLWQTIFMYLFIFTFTLIFTYLFFILTSYLLLVCIFIYFYYCFVYYNVYLYLFHCVPQMWGNRSTDHSMYLLLLSLAHLQVYRRLYFVLYSYGK